ncbi:MAG TPA: HAMP domain-containing sensor histidine kinase [Myxococcales bacterium]|nr:HAMP domain-containing sensor histidine kinase [Myxococcales bacterium]
MRVVELDESVEVENGTAARLSDLTAWSGEVAHELKNPLAGIKALALLMELDPSSAPERLKLLLGEVDRMRGIVDDFLNFSRPFVPSAKQTVDLGELCREVVAVHEGIAATRHVRLAAPRDSLEVRCDPRKTKQILVNLLQNALEASTDGGDIRVVIAAQNGFASISVMDRGCGLPSAMTMTGRAFQRGVTSKANGSGLGLTIASSLAEQHGGSLRLSNRDGGGCIAELLLPLR